MSACPESRCSFVELMLIDNAVRVVKRPSFSTFILKSSLVYVEGGLHAEFEVWEYSDTAYAMENAHRVKHQTLWKGGQQWKYF